MKVQCVSLLALLVLWACDPDDHCKFTGGWTDGAYTCEEGFVCNVAFNPPTCERPNVHRFGEICGSDDNCMSSLWCEVGESYPQMCAARLGKGERCPAGSGCAQGLTCTKSTSSTTPTCE